MHFFSVVIPLYNKADTILRTIRSVAAQTFRDFDVVVIDDGSTDSSAAVLMDFFASNEWRTTGIDGRLISQNNAGVSAARNRGVKEATSRFVAMLDADDTWLPEHLADLYKVHSEFPEAKAIATRTMSVQCGQLPMIPTRRGRIELVDIFNCPNGRYPMHSSTVAFERDYFMTTLGYDVRFSFYEDREFYYRVAEEVGAFCVNYDISAYYYHDARESATKGRRYRYAEYAHLNLFESRLKSGTISKRMSDCARTAANRIIRGNVVRWNWKLVEEFFSAFPCISKMPFPVSVCDWRTHKILIWAVYFVEWLFVRGPEHIAGIFHAKS